jgi:uncharacterized spore protein YtfJ
VVKIEEIIEQASDAIGSKRVYGEPYEKNGVTVIPAARVMGGAGGGDGSVAGATDESAESVADRQSGVGAGYGMLAGPAGAFVIKGDQVRWMPAIDINRIVLGGQIVAIVALLVLRSIAKARAKAAAG